MAISEQSVKSFTSRKQINLQCIIIISLRGRASTKMMSKWFHESFQLKSHVHTHPVSNSRGKVKNRSVDGSASATKGPASHPPWPSFCWDGFFQGPTVIVTKQAGNEMGCWTLGSFITQKNMIMHLKRAVILLINASSPCTLHWMFRSVVTRNLQSSCPPVGLQLLHEY